MDGERAARLALFAVALLLVQAAVPTALGHAGEKHEDAGGDEEANEGGGVQLTPDREFADQRHPDVDGPRVVWQERTPGENWEIVLANVSANVSVVPVTNTDHDEKRPVINGDWVAWTVHDEECGRDEDLAMLDLVTGRIRHVPDMGGDEEHPRILDNGTLLYVTIDDEGRRVLHGYDARSDQVFHPIGKREVVGEPAAHGDTIAWGEGSPSSTKFHLVDTGTGNVTEVPGVYNVVDGPEMHEAGLAWIARYGAKFDRGTYTTVYNETTGVDKMRSHVYPHSRVAACPTGVVWNQPGTSVSEAPTVALWDRFVDGTLTLGNETFGGDCGADHLVLEKTVQGEAGSGRDTRQLQLVDLAEVRLPRDASIRLDENDRRRVLRSPATLEGTARSADPREPIEEVYGRVDGGTERRLDTIRTDDGLAWEAPIEPRGLDSGRHQLEIAAVDAQGRVTVESFVFYTETPYNVDPSALEGASPPRTGESPFPLNVFNHYQDYQPFYNSVFLALLAIAGLAWYAYKKSRETTPARPKYVPPDEPEIDS